MFHEYIITLEGNHQLSRWALNMEELFFHIQEMKLGKIVIKIEKKLIT